jgi:hypothetical protein
MSASFMRSFEILVLAEKWSATLFASTSQAADEAGRRGTK